MYKVSKVGCKNIHLHANYKYIELKKSHSCRNKTRNKVFFTTAALQRKATNSLLLNNIS